MTDFNQSTNLDLSPAQLDPLSEEALKLCVGTHPGLGKYIHLNKLLQLLTERGIVIASHTAKPGRDAISTELLRGRRTELLNLIYQLKKVTK